MMIASKNCTISSDKLYVTVLHILLLSLNFDTEAKIINSISR